MRTRLLLPSALAPCCVQPGPGHAGTASVRMHAFGTYDLEKKTITWNSFDKGHSQLLPGLQPAQLLLDLPSPWVSAQSVTA